MFSNYSDAEVKYAPPTNLFLIFKRHVNSLHIGTEIFAEL